MHRTFPATAMFVVLVLLVAGCAGGPTPPPTVTGVARPEATRETAGTPARTRRAAETPAAPDEATAGLDVAEKATANPEATAQATELPEYRWSQLLSRDAIRPIYDPEFVSADEAGYDDDELVMGVAIAEAAKAYPVGLLNSREMVNDELAGIPILVTF